LAWAEADPEPENGSVNVTWRGPDKAEKHSAGSDSAKSAERLRNCREISKLSTEFGGVLLALIVE
jgi:hypothetical protein